MSFEVEDSTCEFQSWNARCEFWLSELEEVRIRPGIAAVQIQKNCEIWSW